MRADSSDGSSRRMTDAAAQARLWNRTSDWVDCPTKSPSTDETRAFNNRSDQYWQL